MPSITIRDIPAETLQHLRQLAKRQRRSLNAELLHRIDKSVAEDAQDAAWQEDKERYLADAHAHAKAVGNAGLTIDMIDEIIDGAAD